MSVWRGLVTKRCQELRFLFCNTSEHSSGVRAFVKNQYTNIKSDNPNLPVLVRESQNFKPMVIARFDYGVEQAADLSGATEEQVQKALESIISQHKA